MRSRQHRVKSQGLYTGSVRHVNSGKEQLCVFFLHPTIGTIASGQLFCDDERMIEYQEDHVLFCFLVNYHALTTVTSGELLRKQTLEAACDFLALGIDPDKSIFWVQGDVLR